jgi:hypothetical protein
VTDDLGRFVLVLRAGPDPLLRRGLKGRTEVYRLKLLLKGVLRQFGFVVVEMKELYPSPYVWGWGEGI